MTATTETKERPIIFNSAMVRAILDGRKTQTRRVVKPQPPVECVEVLPCPGRTWKGYREESPHNLSCTDYLACPYGTPGDHLWVRETWAPTFHGNDLIFKADEPCADFPFKGPWNPSIHLPRQLSRITLEITGVRVERLQEISEEDAIAEGVRDIPVATIPRPAVMSEAADFRNVWESIYCENPIKGWAANPWVWVVEFKRI